MKQFKIKLLRRNIPKKELLEDLRNIAAKLGRTKLTRSEYDEHGTYGATTILRHFGKWNEALKVADISISTRQDITNEDLFENLIEVWTKLGKQPYGRHMSDKSLGAKFSLGTYEKRFGSWNNALTAFSEYISDIEAEKPLENVVELEPAVNLTPRNVNWRLRAKILIRDNCICKMCGDSPTKNPDCVLHVDHIVAWSNGGRTVEENLQTLCKICNIGKSNVL